MTSPTTEQMRERAEKGEDVVKARQAQGEPGQKQPEHKDYRASAEEAVETLNKMTEQFQVKTKQSSAKRSQEGGNLNETPPQDRKPGTGPLATQPMDIAGGAIMAARAQVTRQLETDARLLSDPRYERDQQVYELGQMGKLPLVPPSEAELAARVARSGLPQEVLDKIPKTADEQVADDQQRLQKAEEAQLGPSITAGEQEQEKKNNGPEKAGDNVRTTGAVSEPPRGTIVR